MSRESLNRAVLSAFPHVGAMVFDADLRFVVVEGPALAQAGFDASFVGRTLYDVVGPEQIEALETPYRAALRGEHTTLEWRSPDGQRTLCLEISPVRDEAGAITGGLVAARDVTDQREVERELRRLAYEDPLTRQFNRRRFEQELDRQVERSRRYGERAALLLLDLDRFKEVNDSYGHLTGDKALRHVASTLAGRLRTSDVLARLGGDEFAVLLAQVTPDEAATVAEDLLAQLSARPLIVEGRPLALTASLGIAFLDERVRDAEKVLGIADGAMYDAKAAGRNRVSGARLRALETADDARTSTTLRVVHCDDSEPYRRLLSLMLSAHSDIAIVGEAGTADEALRAVEEADPDVIVLDAHMPGNEADSVAALRRQSPNARILVLSGLARRDEAISGAADAFTTKSATFDEIAAAVRALGPPRGAVTAVLQ